MQVPAQDVQLNNIYPRKKFPLQNLDTVTILPKLRQLSHNYPIPNSLVNAVIIITNTVITVIIVVTEVDSRIYEALGVYYSET